MKPDWTTGQLGDLFEIVTGGTPSKSNKEMFGDYMPLVKPPELNGAGIWSSQDWLSELGAAASRVLPVGSVLVSCIGNLGKVGISEVELATNQQINSIKPNTDRALPEFIYLLVQSPGFKKNLHDLASGTTVPIVNKSKFQSIPIHLPPISEQKRIVTILDEAFTGIDAAIANTEKNLANARELFEKFTSEVIFGDPEKQGWQKTNVSACALPEKGAIRTGPFGSQLLHGEFVDSGIAVLGIDNVVKNKFMWGKKRYISEEKYEQLKRYTVRPGDVLITIMGTCGRCAIVPEDVPTAINTKHLCCISLDKGICLPEFLHAYFLYHPVARQFLESRAKGSIMAGLNMGIIKELPVWLPGIDEQRRVVARVGELYNEILRLQSVYEQKCSALMELKQSLLQKAFSGELTDELVERQMDEAVALVKPPAMQRISSENSQG
jgi:type I restriction enzyme S subunit